MKLQTLNELQSSEKEKQFQFNFCKLNMHEIMNNMRF